VSGAEWALSGEATAVLEKERERMRDELQGLSKWSYRGGQGNVGWCSVTQKEAAPEWVQITLRDEAPIDQVVIVPVLHQNLQGDYKVDSFPEAYRIMMGGSASDPGREVARYERAAGGVRLDAPVIVPIPQVSAAWVRVEFRSVLSGLGTDNHRSQLAEVLVFSGKKNLALRQPVEVSSIQRDWVLDAVSAGALTDGLTPYEMNTGRGQEGYPYSVYYGAGQAPCIDIDLGSSFSLEQVNLHRAVTRELVPRIHASDFGLPYELTVEGALNADFSDARVLTEYRRRSLYETGPIIRLPLQRGRPSRYIRIRPVKGYQLPYAQKELYCIAFNEIELLDREGNQARQKTITCSGEMKVSKGRPQRMNDGHNLNGEIISDREWLEELVLRAGLESQLPVIEILLAERYERQKRNLNIMYWVVGIALALFMGLVLLGKQWQRRQLQEAKDRLAADLHDELGGNLHAIGLLGDTAQAIQGDRGQLTALLVRMRDLIERSGVAARHCVDLLEANELYGDLPAEMYKISERTLYGIEYEIEIGGEEYVKGLSARLRIDLILFYKEVLTNILRHAQASQVKISLQAGPKRGTLSVSDNGGGPKLTRTPRALKRRARLIGGRIKIESTSPQGTTVHLQFRYTPPFLNRLLS